jgi:hypothetical protein
MASRGGGFLVLAGFLLTLAAFLSYFLFFAMFPVTRDSPWLNLVLFLAAGATLGVGLKRTFQQPVKWWRKALAVAATALSATVFGLFVFYNYYLSRQLPPAENAPRIGQKAPDFTLPDQHGRPVTLSAVLAGESRGRPQRALLIFYRGYW